jgi:hypothetical protein
VRYDPRPIQYKSEIFSSFKLVLIVMEGLKKSISLMDLYWIRI